jgi:drug/metabolite transporter (DMT)-like permease
MKQFSSEKTGELMIFGEMLTYSFFPIIIAYSTKILPPVMFAALSILIATFSLLLYLIITKNLKSVFNASALKYILGVTLFIVILPSIFIFVGSSKTSGINTSILLQSEILFTFIIYGIFAIEKITVKKSVGALLVLVGTFFILYNGKSAINIGDLMIIVGTFFYPIGNYFAKKALEITSPSAILFTRNLIGGIVLLIFSLIFENQFSTYQNVISYWPFILLNGIIVYHLSKTLWYEGIKRIDVSKAIAISCGGSPAFSLILAILILNEIPTIYQIAGFATVAIGIFVLIMKTKNLRPTDI